MRHASGLILSISKPPNIGSMIFGIEYTENNKLYSKLVKPSMSRSGVCNGAKLLQYVFVNIAKQHTNSTTHLIAGYFNLLYWFRLLSLLSSSYSINLYGQRNFLTLHKRCR